MPDHSFKKQYTKTFFSANYTIIRAMQNFVRVFHNLPTCAENYKYYIKIISDIELLVSESFNTNFK